MFDGALSERKFVASEPQRNLIGTIRNRFKGDEPVVPWIEQPPGSGKTTISLSEAIYQAVVKRSETGEPTWSIIVTGDRKLRQSIRNDDHISKEIIKQTPDLFPIPKGMKRAEFHRQIDECQIVPLLAKSEFMLADVARRFVNKAKLTFSSLKKTASVGGEGDFIAMIETNIAFQEQFDRTGSTEGLDYYTRTDFEINDDYGDFKAILATYELLESFEDSFYSDGDEFPACYEPMIRNDRNQFDTTVFVLTYPKVYYADLGLFRKNIDYYFEAAFLAFDEIHEAVIFGLSVGHVVVDFVAFEKAVTSLAKSQPELKPLSKALKKWNKTLVAYYESPLIEKTIKSKPDKRVEYNTYYKTVKGADVNWGIQFADPCADACDEVWRLSDDLKIGDNKAVLKKYRSLTKNTPDCAFPDTRFWIMFDANAVKNKPFMGGTPMNFLVQKNSIRFELDTNNPGSIIRQVLVRYKDDPKAVANVVCMSATLRPNRTVKALGDRFFSWFGCGNRVDILQNVMVEFGSDDTLDKPNYSIVGRTPKIDVSSKIERIIPGVVFPSHTPVAAIEFWAKEIVRLQKFETPLNQNHRVLVNVASRADQIELMQTLRLYGTSSVDLIDPASFNFERLFVENPKAILVTTRHGGINFIQRNPDGSHISMATRLYLTRQPNRPGISNRVIQSYCSDLKSIQFIGRGTRGGANQPHLLIGYGDPRFVKDGTSIIPSYFTEVKI